MPAIDNYYSSYKNSESNFKNFHNEVINMPRAAFGEISDFVRMLQRIAGYISLIDRNVLEGVLNYKVLYAEMLNNYRNGIVPTENRDLGFELRFFEVRGDIDSVYKSLGRLFRHYMEYFSFFGVIKNANNRSNKTIDLDALNELVYSNKDNLFDVLRNKLLEINIKDNDLINNLNGIKISQNADYNPAKTILKYCKKINRPVTSFEISILFGRVDSLQTDNEILKRALEISKDLPNNYTEQVDYIFNNMGWKNSRGELYEYAQSQQPEFKFKVFLLFMKTFKLINFNESTNLITLTQYSNDLIQDDISIDILDLNNLLMMIDDDTEDSNKLLDIIIRKRTETITKAIEEDGEIVIKLNKRSIRNPIIKNGRRVRNKLIAELAKVKAGYLDEITGLPSFEGKNGHNYVEAHHIIEFSTENGPDVTDNLICLGPQNHSLIHHGSDSTLEDFYRTCQTRGVITLERFKNISNNYKCLTDEHVDTLVAKKIISKLDAEELKKLIAANGVDDKFLEALNIPSSK